MRGREWTFGEVATLRRMAKAGYTDGEIGRHLQRARTCICEKRKELDIPSGLMMSPGLKAALARLNARRLLKVA